MEGSSVVDTDVREPEVEPEAGLEPDHEPELATGVKVVGSAGAVAPPRQHPVEIDKAAASPAAAKKMTDGERVDAMAWLLSDEDEDMGDYQEELELNLGTGTAKKIVPWIIRPLDGDTFTQLRKRAQGNRASRRSDGEVDVNLYNLAIVAAATVSPDVAAAAAAKGLGGSADPLLGPMQIIANRFAHKPLLVTQIAGRVLEISGADEDDMAPKSDNAALTRAVGNSR